MTNVFFVHGTGVRDVGYHETMARIAKGLGPLLPGLRLSGVSWGALAGVNVSDKDIEAVLPPADKQAVRAVGPAEIDAELWSALLEDPLFELRLAAARPPPAPGAIPLGVPAARPKPIDERLRGLTDAWPKDQPPAGGVALADLQAAADWLARDPDASAVLNNTAAIVGDPNDPALVEPVARAVVARTLAQARGEIGRGPDALYVGAERDALVGQVGSALSEGVLGGFDWLKDLAIKFAEAKATGWGKSRRADLMETITPGVGDILKWQRRGDDRIASEVLKGIIAAGDDVVVIGHSLGGVMLVDLLSGNRRPTNVKALVTVGSQAPMFLLCDALEALRPPGATARPFTPWLNIYDRNDFLSFCAQRVFPNATGIEDHEVASKVPFPDAHGAYWRSDAVYRKIAAWLPK